MSAGTPLWTSEKWKLYGGRTKTIVTLLAGPALSGRSRSMARRTPSDIGIITLRSRTASDWSSASVSRRCCLCCGVSVPCCCAPTTPAAAAVATMVARIRRRVDVLMTFSLTDSVVDDFDFAAVVGRDAVDGPARVSVGVGPPRVVRLGHLDRLIVRHRHEGAKRRAVGERDAETVHAFAEKEGDEIPGLHLCRPAGVGLEDVAERRVFRMRLLDDRDAGEHEEWPLSVARFSTAGRRSVGRFAARSGPAAGSAP